MTGMIACSMEFTFFMISVRSPCASSSGVGGRGLFGGPGGNCGGVDGTESSDRAPSPGLYEIGLVVREWEVAKQKRTTGKRISRWRSKRKRKPRDPSSVSPILPLESRLFALPVYSQWFRWIAGQEGAVVSCSIRDLFGFAVRIRTLHGVQWIRRRLHCRWLSTGTWHCGRLSTAARWCLGLCLIV